MTLYTYRKEQETSKLLRKYEQGRIIMNKNELLCKTLKDFSFQIFFKIFSIVILVC